ncbi:PucR family transcriptional regulator [Streptomyces antnestii]|uniref:PucR family transcriptional regulator n=1 Tax=Streptomyces antnestii TaxID=2494256 RepID=A0A3S2VIK5_9ACTN|nr:helix-turn-helix domain-containing protein [Streptomyces sp. San01]RVU28107.1 PucR family transcriptional regulator [Streptomyces sp. San01]
MEHEQLRMSGLGSGPESMMRIVAYFDGLGESAADADTVVKHAAALAECGTGGRLPSGIVVRYGPLGDRLDGVPQVPDAGARPLPEAWLERAGPAHPLDQVLLDRLLHALRMLDVRPPARTGLHLGDPALVEVLLSDDEHRTDRVRAVELSGLDPGRDVRVLALYADQAGPVVELIERVCPGRLVRSAPTGGLTAVLTQTPVEDRLLCDALHTALAAAAPAPPRPGGGHGPWIGIGERMSVYAAPTSWAQARRALRFASSTVYGRRAVAFGRLGPLDLLADVPLGRLLGARGIARVNALAATATGAQDVDTLEAFCVYGSLRRTACELHVHHSTVASRLARVEAATDWDLGNSIDRFIATLVLMLRRMALSSAELAAAEGADGGTGHPTG